MGSRRKTVNHLVFPLTTSSGQFGVSWPSWLLVTTYAQLDAHAHAKSCTTCNNRPASGKFILLLRECRTYVPAEERRVKETRKLKFWYD